VLHWLLLVISCASVWLPERAAPLMRQNRAKSVKTETAFPMTLLAASQSGCREGAVYEEMKETFTGEYKN